MTAKSTVNAKMVKARIVNNDEIPTEVLASAIKEVAECITRLRAGKINDCALILLIAHACRPKMALDTVRVVLNAIEDLPKTYLKKPKGGR